MRYKEPTVFDAPFKRLSYFITFTEKDLLETLSNMGVQHYGLPYLETTLATTFQKWEGEMRINVVYFPIPQTAPCSAANISHVVHEAVHVVEDVFDRMGEAAPSEEFRAYLTGEVTKNLVGEFLNYIGVGAAHD